MHPASDPTSLPNLVVIGGAKTGSTSLHHYLGRHPDVFMARGKEVRFFSDHFEKGAGWYRSHFRDAGAFAIRGETSPQYTAFPQVGGVPERMHGLIPDAKLIYIVRDPLARMWSHFAFVTPVSDPEEFRRALTPLETNPFVAGSRQGWQLEQYLRYFPLEKILILSNEELRRDRRATLARVFRFLGVDETFYSGDCELELNVSTAVPREHSALSKLVARVADLNLGRWIPTRIGVPIRNRGLRLLSKPPSRPLLDAGLEDRLREIFSRDAKRLRQLTGLPFEHWSV
jgi:hypothetical protein